VPPPERERERERRESEKREREGRDREGREREETEKGGGGGREGGRVREVLVKLRQCLLLRTHISSD
jgi:hypothetical protein